MKLLFLTSGRRTPTSRFRVHPFIPRLQAAGHTCVVSPSRPEKYEHWPWLGWRLSVRARVWLRQLDLWLARWGRFDVVYIERELFDSPDGALEAAFRKVTRRLVLDIDDGIFLTYPDKFARTASLVDMVIAGSEPLAEVARQHASQVAVVPTCIDLRRYTARASASPVTQPHPTGPDQSNITAGPPVVGWMGTRSNLPYLELLREPLEQLARRYPFIWRVVTNLEATGEVPSFSGVTAQVRGWSDATEVSELHQFDIGVMPLRDEPWTRFKCGCKLIQYMAAGAAGIASPVGVNPEIADHGRAALLANSPADWEAQLERLLTDEPFCRSLSAAGRERAETHYSVDAVFPSWSRAVLGS